MHPLRGAKFAESSREIFSIPFEGDADLPTGDKRAYTDKQKRQAEHIEEGYEDRGVSKKEAQSRAWATVNKESGGGKKSGSGRSKISSRKSGKKASKKK